MKSKLQSLSAQIGDCMIADRHSLQRRLRRIQGDQRAGKDCSRRLGTLEAAIQSSLQRASTRAASLPRPVYPSDLPVAEQHQRIAREIDTNQVVIVCGETGSGKTTQLPKICLELGRGARGLIGHTQPRRIAARSVAARIATELGCQPGTQVGYKIRFRDQVGAGTCIKLMTDGILLAEIQGDRFLTQYDTLIIDEAHERSLIIDFLLGYLHQLLPRRPDLKLIITSATIDPERFARHFNDAPVITVSGRTYPVEAHYRPLAGEDDETSDMPGAILGAVDEASRLGPGDILIFLAGEREIRDTAEALRKHHPPHTEIVPLYARLGTAEQNRVFKPHKGRRIVLATNVAETSLTVPGIRYVIDPGYARLSRYSYRTRVQRLPVEKISRASANQRMGRCGRIGAGACFRLYTEEDFEARPLYTDPEILRTNLASVILQMKALGLGGIERFPFIDPPDRRMIKDGYRLLDELGALQGEKLSPIGRQLARLPVDPRIGRMLIAAHDYHCLSEILVIASALSIQDPRDRPLEKQQKADEAHLKFADKDSDFLSFLKLWTFYMDRRKHLSRNKLRKLCRQNFLSPVRMEEWRDIHSQLHTQVSEMGMSLNALPADDNAIHQALLTGLLTHIGFKEEDPEYAGTRNRSFHIFPGSGLVNKRPKWIMAAELIETSRLYAHTIARIQPGWIETIGAHLIKRSYSEPHWSKRAAQVRALEKTTLYGLTINPGRRVHYGAIEPAAAREIFIRNALVAFEYSSKAPFFLHNRQLIHDIESLEHRSRRHDILVDDEILFRFYDDRIPEGIYSGRRFEQWRKKAERKNPRLLFLERADLMQHDAESVTGMQYPTSLSINGVEMELAYHFEPGHPEDGVTLVIPLPVLNTLHPARFEWLVPGMLREKIIEMIRSLPKTLRRNFVPVPAIAGRCADTLRPDGTPLALAVASFLKQQTGIELAAGNLDPASLPDHLRMNYRVVDGTGRILGTGRDLAALQTELGAQAQESFSSEVSWELERTGLKDWDFDTLPACVTKTTGGVTVRGYPAIADDGRSVSLRILETPEQAMLVHRTGMQRLFILRLSRRIRDLERHLPGINTLCLQYMPVAGCDALKQDLIRASIDRTFLADIDDIRSRADFDARLAEGASLLVGTANTLCERIAAILHEFHQIRQQIKGSIPPAWLAAVQDIREQLDHLVYDGFVLRTPDQWLARIPLYLKAIQYRLEKLRYDPDKDRRSAALIARHWEKCLSRMQESEPGRANEEFETYRWMIEELRISLFAQQLRTLFPVSAQRLDKQWEKLKRNRTR